MVLILLTLGFSSVIGQVVLMRELVAVFFGNELVFGLILAWWLLWEAVGAWVLGRWVTGRGWDRRAVAITLALAALTLPVQVTVVRSIRDLLGVTPGASFSLSQMVLVVGLVLSPYCLAHGLGFSLSSKLLAGGSAGRAYAYESAGAVAGGVLFSFILINHLNPFQIILLVAMIALFATARYSSRVSHRLTFIARNTPFVLLAAAAGIGAMIPLGSWLHQATQARQWPQLVFSGDSRYGRLTITAQGEQRAFFENGLLAFETESTFPEEVVHLPMLAHPNPRRVLLIGGGVAGDLAQAFKHDVTKIVYVELDPLVIEAARFHLPPQQAGILDDSRLTLVFQDGRRYTKLHRERFDVIIVDLPEPSTGQLNRFYTLEFFEEAKALLDEGGVFSFGLPSAENYWNPELTRRNASVYHTLRQVFPTVLITPGDHNFFLATTGPSFPNAVELGERMRARDIVTRWVTPEYIEFILTSDRFYAIQADLASAASVKLNRDLSPICYFYDLALWISRFGSSLRGLFETASLLHASWLLLPLIAIIAISWGRRRTTALALVTGTGFAGMTLQVVFLLTFQALHGYVYHQIGLLVTTFMLGLTLGAGTISGRRITSARRWLVGIQGGLALFALSLAVFLPWESPAPGLVFPVMAGVAGALTGAVFPLAASLLSPDETKSVAGMLYGADLLGGCIGALAASALLVPVLGVVQTCVAVALVAGSGTLLVCHRFSTR